MRLRGNKATSITGTVGYAPLGPKDKLCGVGKVAGGSLFTLLRLPLLGLCQLVVVCVLAAATAIGLAYSLLHLLVATDFAVALGFRPAHLSLICALLLLQLSLLLLLLLPLCELSSDLLAHGEAPVERLDHDCGTYFYSPALCFFLAKIALHESFDQRRILAHQISPTQRS